MLVALAVGSVTERLTLTRDESKVLEFIESIRNTQVPAPERSFPWRHWIFVIA